MHYIHMSASFPTSQRALLRAARGALSQAKFAEVLGVDRTCLSRYESEKLGAPTRVLNYCLAAVAASLGEGASAPIDRAHYHVRNAALALEELQTPPRNPLASTRSRKNR